MRSTAWRARLLQQAQTLPQEAQTLSQNAYTLSAPQSPVVLLTQTRHQGLCPSQRRRTRRAWAVKLAASVRQSPASQVLAGWQAMAATLLLLWRAFLKRAQLSSRPRQMALTAPLWSPLYAE